MSTLVGENHHQLLTSPDDLVRYFQRNAKPVSHRRLGLEAEFFGVDKKTGKALAYSGKAGIEAVLQALASRFEYEKVLDGGRLIALTRGGSTLLGLEPGGQLELSAPPVADVFEVEKQVGRFLAEMRAIAPEFPDTAWLAVGIHPFSRGDEIEWVPKHRYMIMADYLKTRGRLSHEMMKRTCTNQVNLDFSDEKDAMDALRVSLAITSIVTALFANSSFAEGRPSGFSSERLAIWNETDPDRTGLLLEFIRPGKTFKDYVQYLLRTPMIFIVRNGKWIPVRCTFGQFLKDGWEGAKAELGDFELHLSTSFPEVRLKQYVEIRGIDCQKPALIPAVAAFWKGILYDSAAREAAWRLVESASDEDRLALHLAVPRQGLRAELSGRPIAPLAAELVDIAAQGLERQKSPGGRESVFLEHLREAILKPGKTPGEQLLELWAGSRDPARLIAYLDILSGA